MRPLDRLPSIKAKLSVAIVAAVAVTVAVVAAGVRAGLPILVLGAAAGALSLGMIHFLARGMTSPLREMASAARAMAKGDHERRVTDTSMDEVGELARAFNRMAADLGEIDRMRRDLLANVSHELRTPISALQAVLENVVDGVQEPDPETLATMLAQVQRLGVLVAQLLDLSRLESGAARLQLERFPVRSMLEQSLKEASLHRPQVIVDLDVEPAGLEAKADPVKLHQVVTNLVDNAMRHSESGQQVVVRARGGNSLKLEVADEGPGIDRGEREKVFDRFYRTDRTKPSDGGSGLGLAISRWIVDLHGGKIHVEDNQPQGCKMIVEIPQT